MISLNWDLKSPFIDISATWNPGVGHYLKSKYKTQITSIIPEEPEINRAFLSGPDKQMTFMKSNFIPGPGAYDLNF